MSRQFDVHRLRLPPGRRRPSFLVNLQSDFLNVGPTVVVAPLWLEAERFTPPPASVRTRFQGDDYWLILTDIAHVRLSDLGPVDGNLDQERERIIRGLDLLFTGI